MSDLSYDNVGQEQISGNSRCSFSKQPRSTFLSQMHTQSPVNAVWQVLLVWY